MNLLALSGATVRHAALGLALCIPGHTVAQDAGSLLRQQELQEPRVLRDAPAQPPQTPVQTPAALPNTTKVHLRSVRFQGATQLLAQSQLQAVVADAIGQDLDLAALQQLAGRVTSLLKAQGYFLARAYLPQQDVTSGDLEIRLVAGFLSPSEPVRISEADQGSLRMHAQGLRAIADANLQGGKAAREQDMERSVLLMGDLPGITAKARIEPGLEPESTQVLVDVEEGPLLSGTLSLDNFGNRSTGESQINGLLNVNDPLQIGDQFSLGFVHADGFDSGRLNYNLPLGAQGTRLAATASQLDYRHVDGLGVTAALQGSASTVGLMLSHPLIRSRVSNLTLELDARRKSTKDNASTGNLHDKAADSTSLGLHADHYDGFGGGGLSLANLTYGTGNLDLSANAVDAATDAKAYHTQGQFSKWNWGATRLQKLDGTFTLYANLTGQTALGNLDSSEQFILGGPYGLRAYSGGEAAGDSGWLVNLELRYDLAANENGAKWQLTGFYDVGQIQLHQDTRGIVAATASGSNEYQLAGWGVGAQLNKTGNYTLRLVWAQKMGSNPGSSASGMDADGRADSTRIWFTGTLFF